MPQHMDEIYQVIDRCGLFVAIGTSGQVYPAAGFVLQARRRARAHTVELNLEPTENEPLFQERIYGPATQVVPPFVERVLKRGWKQ
jgi:NAD-dependent deacetylase